MRILTIAVLVALPALLGYGLGAAISSEINVRGVVGAVIGAGLGFVAAWHWYHRLRLLRPQKVKIGFLGSDIELVVDESSRRAAWALWVEYNSRITRYALEGDQGILREALTSLYNLFGVTRQILRDAGPSTDLRPVDGDGRTYTSVAECALRMLNEVVRPVTATWHPRLPAHEAERPEKYPVAPWEAQWEDREALRQALRDLVPRLEPWIAELRRIAQHKVS